MHEKFLGSIFKLVRNIISDKTSLRTKVGNFSNFSCARKTVYFSPPKPGFLRAPRVAWADVGAELGASGAGMSSSQDFALASEGSVQTPRHASVPSPEVIQSEGAFYNRVSQQGISIIGLSLARDL